MRTRMKTIAAVARGFLRAKRGNVAMMFGLALVPLVLAAGAGLDYSRAMLVRQQMGEALEPPLAWGHHRAQRNHRPGAGAKILRRQTYHRQDHFDRRQFSRYL